MAARTTKGVGIVLGLALFGATAARATVVEVPLADLNGTYSCADPTSYDACTKTVTVHLPAIPAAIHGVSLRIEGSTTFAQFQCDLGQLQSVNTRFEAVLYESGSFGNYFVADYLNPESGAVAVTRSFTPGAFTSSTWDFLLDGTGTLGFHIDGSSAILECFVVPGQEDSTTLDRVTLLVDGEFPTPARSFSWGRLKQIYR